MKSFLGQIFTRWLGIRKGIPKRRERTDDYDVLKNLGREQLERLKKKGLSIPVVMA